jgi:hypothetical protein
MQQVSIASSSVARHLQMEWLEWMKDSQEEQIVEKNLRT